MISRLVLSTRKEGDRQKRDSDRMSHPLSFGQNYELAVRTQTQVDSPDLHSSRSEPFFTR